MLLLSPSSRMLPPVPRRTVGARVARFPTAQHDRVHRLAGIRDEGLPIIVDWLLIVAGFALLVGGGEALVRGAGGIALGGRP